MNQLKTGLLMVAMTVLLVLFFRLVLEERIRRLEAMAGGMRRAS